MVSKLGKSRKSNHKKKAWKHIDLAEIDQYLEDKELDERTGRVGKELFFINKEGDSDNIKRNKLNNLIDDIDKEIINDKPTTRSKLSNLKTFRSLGSTSAVPAFKPDKRINQKTTPLESIRKSKRLDKVAQNLEKSKETDAKEKKVVKTDKYDLWQDKPKTPIGDLYVDYAEDFEKVRLSRIFKCQSKQNPNLKKKPSLLPAVEEPHPGLSYNPKKDEHDDLLISIGDKIKKAKREKRKLNKLVKQGFDPTVNVHLENAKEMASGLFSESEQENEDNEEEIEQEKDQKETKNVIVSDLKRRKTKKAIRNKLKERIDKRKSIKRKAKKRLETALTKIKHFVKEAQTAENKLKLRMQLREQRKINKLYKPARLGKEKYKDPEPEFCLESELNGSLRKINTDGNLLMDRFKSLQRRNLIEHRRVQLKKRSRPTRKFVIRSSIFNKDIFEKEFLKEDD